MKSLIISICILGVVGTIIGITAWSAPTGTISTTVTARNLSINKTAGTAISYGTMDLGGTTSTDPAGSNVNTQIFNNNGSVAKFEIMTDRTTGGSTPWLPNTTTSSDQFVHRFATTTDVTWQILDAEDTYETASSTVEAGVSLNFYMRIDMPTASTEYVQKSIAVTVQAAAP